MGVQQLGNLVEQDKVIFEFDLCDLLEKPTPKQQKVKFCSVSGTKNHWVERPFKGDRWEWWKQGWTAGKKPHYIYLKSASPFSLMLGWALGHIRLGSGSEAAQGVQISLFWTRNRKKCTLIGDYAYWLQNVHINLIYVCSLRPVGHCAECLKKVQNSAEICTYSKAVGDDIHWLGNVYNFVFIWKDSVHILHKAWWMCTTAGCFAH